MNIGIVTLSASYIVSLLNIPGAEFRGAWWDVNTNTLRLSIEAPAMPYVAPLGAIPDVSLWDTVKTCEHRGIIERITEVRVDN